MSRAGTIVSLLPNRYGGLSGLGQDIPDVSTGDTGSSLPLGVPYYTGAPITPTTFPSSGPGTLATILGSPVVAGAAKAAETIALQQTNPLYQLQRQAISTPGTYLQQTPSGTVISSGGAVPGGFTTASLGSMLPILLIGGLVVMMVSRR
jgi:hypothetical protein